MMAVVAALCGIAVAMGLWLLGQTLIGKVIIGARTAPDGQPSRVFAGSGYGMDRRTLLFAGAGALLAVAIIAMTQLVVAAVAAGLAVVFIPMVIQSRVERDRAIAKMRAASEFVEAIRGSIGAGSGIEAAIIESAMRPPDALSDELSVFVEYSKLPEVTTEQALHQLAADAQEPAIDLLVGSLLAALRGAAGDMGQLFERIADNGRSFAESRALTQAERAKVEFQTKLLSLLVVGVAILSVLVSPDLTSAYDSSLIGQVRLLIPAAIFGFGWWWLTRMNRVESAYRFQLREVPLS